MKRGRCVSLVRTGLLGFEMRPVLHGPDVRQGIQREVIAEKFDLQIRRRVWMVK